MGLTGYVLTFALTDFINKNSEWLRATCIETRGSVENVRTLADHPEKQSVWLGLCNPLTRHVAEIGAPPMKKSFKGIKVIANGIIASSMWVTLDPQIKTHKDFIGKRIGVGFKASPQGYIPVLILKHGLGILDKVKLMHIGQASAVKDALLDGMIDVGHLPLGSLIGTEGDFTPVPATASLFTARKCYPISFDEEGIIKTRKKSGYPLVPLHTKVKTYGRTEVPAMIGWAGGTQWYVHESMPDETVKEILRILWDNADNFVKYHAAGKAVKKDTLAKAPEIESMFHPAAIDFYTSKGITKIGIGKAW